MNLHSKSPSFFLILWVHSLIPRPSHICYLQYEIMQATNEGLRTRLVGAAYIMQNVEGALVGITSNISHWDV